MINFVERANAMKEELIANRRYLHQHPELGFELPMTTAFVKKKLQEYGLTAEEICPCGLVVVIEGKLPGKTILLRGDMDALPMKEENDLPFRNDAAVAHTCGHDMHTAMLLGAARLLQDCRDTLCGRVKLMFQPAEETINGANAMINAGLLENPKVDVAMGMHVDTLGNVGDVLFGSGYTTASGDVFKITVTGDGCHGSTPFKGVDPLNAAVQIYLAYQSLIARETPPSGQAVLTFGQFSGGNSSNIIPHEVVMQGSLRTRNGEVRENLRTRMRELAQDIGKAYRCQVEYQELAGTPSLVTNPALLDEMVGYVADMDYPYQLKPDTYVPASEDFSFISQAVPTNWFMLGAKIPGNNYPQHSPYVVFSEDALPLGTALHAHCAYHWLQHNQ